TASVFCHETWCGNLQPVAAGQEKESITCVVPLNAPGVSIWSRKPYERYVVSEFDNPLAARFDETDSAVLFEKVKVPWERVFCHDNVEMTRAIYMRTPGHAMANHQANVRFLERLNLIVGIASKLAEMNNALHILRCCSPSAGLLRCRLFCGTMEEVDRNGRPPNGELRCAGRCVTGVENRCGA